MKTYSMAKVGSSLLFIFETNPLFLWLRASQDLLHSFFDTVPGKCPSNIFGVLLRRLG